MYVKSIKKEAKNVQVKKEPYQIPSYSSTYYFKID